MTERARRARNEPLAADRIAPGMFEVENRKSGSTHVVDMAAESPVCQCHDYQYRMGPAGGECKHVAFLRQVADGELCSWCGYAHCRPSCPHREARR